MISEADLAALALTLKLALVSTAILLLIGTPLAWWLARTRWRYKFIPEAVVALLADESGSAHVLAGGTDLLVRMKSGFTEPDLIVDIAPDQILSLARALSL